MAAGLQIFMTSCLLLLLMPVLCDAASYEQTKALYDTLLDPGRYNPLQRPLVNQSEALEVTVGFELVSIVEINDVIQSFKCNGFFGLTWKDELLQWNTSDYGGAEAFVPRVTSVFRPQLVLLNTLDERDIFEDDHAPFTVYHDGKVLWVPGSIFPVSCKLDLTKFPLDEQHCELQLVAMNFESHELRIVTSAPYVIMTFFTPSGLWDITGHEVTAPNITVRPRTLTSVVVRFSMKRKPAFLALSTLLPVIFLSLLNLLVFVIPVESGEKISYGITVLLALTLFMSITSAMLPSASESMPLIIFFIFILLGISVLSVVVSICIVWLHHKQDKQEDLPKTEANFWTTMPRIRLSKPTVSPLQTHEANLEATKTGPRKEKLENVDTSNRSRSNSFKPDFSPKSNNSNSFKPDFDLKSNNSNNFTADFSPKSSDQAPNKQKLLASQLNFWSFVVFGVIWVSVTLGFTSAVMA